MARALSSYSSMTFWCRDGRRQQPLHLHQGRPQGQQEGQVSQRLPHQPGCLYKASTYCSIRIRLTTTGSSFVRNKLGMSLAGRTAATCVATSPGRCWTTGSGRPATPPGSGFTSSTTRTTLRDTPRARCDGSRTCWPLAEASMDIYILHCHFRLL